MRRTEKFSLPTGFKWVKSLEGILAFNVEKKVVLFAPTYYYDPVTSVLVLAKQARRHTPTPRKWHKDYDVSIIRLNEDRKVTIRLDTGELVNDPRYASFREVWKAVGYLRSGKPLEEILEKPVYCGDVNVLRRSLKRYFRAKGQQVPIDVRKLISATRKKLTPQQQTAKRLFEDGNNIVETARIMGISKQAVSVLRKTLQHKGAFIDA